MENIKTIEMTKQESRQRKSIGTSLSKFIARKIRRKSISSTKLVKIRSQSQMRRNVSVKSIDFWEEDYGNTIKRLRSVKK